MSTLKLKGSTSGYVELTAPATAGDNTITLPTTAGTVAVKDASNNTEVGTGVTIGSPSSNVFTVSTNGSERVRVDSDGRLGVGKATPATTIDAQAAQAFLQLKSTSGTNLAGVQFVPGGQTNALYIYADGNRNITFDDHATTLMSVRAAASGGGLTFNGDTAAANALDDYEEGTWSPVYNFSTTGDANCVSYGRYIKTGAQVFVQGYVYINSSASLSGNVLIVGLPFASSNLSGQLRSSFTIGNAWRFPDAHTHLRLLLEANSSAIKIFNNATNAFSDARLTSANFTAQAEYNILIFGGSYSV